LEKEFDSQFHQEITEIKNKLIGIKNLFDDSSGIKLLSIVKEKLFFEDNQKIKEKL